jgi:hypothetical protein
MKTPALVVVGFCVGAAAAHAWEVSAQPAPPPAAACAAIAFPTVQGATGSATTIATAVRELFASYLQGPSIAVIQLDAKPSSQAAEEARQKSCDRILRISLSHKRGSAGILGRALGQAGATAAWYAPVGSVGAAATRGAVIAGAQAASEIASATRAKDEMRLEYRIDTPDGRVIVKPTEEKAKASADGEDLLTPLVQRSAESIASALLKP